MITPNITMSRALSRLLIGMSSPPKWALPNNANHNVAEGGELSEGYPDLHFLIPEDIDTGV
jgi:hypothetical protein